MLRQLRISNYALIENVEMHFEKGMTAITGETGSGKSILLGAFGLLLGERADLKAIQDEKKKCIVEAVFDLKGYGLKSFFSENDLDYDQQTTIRREIIPGGKSRAFVNDTPVQLNTLRALGSSLVDIHSQHENSQLGDRIFQFGMTDAFAENEDQLSSYKTVFLSYKYHLAQLEGLETNEAKLRQEMDYMRFQLGELEKANLDELQQKTMEDELETLSNAEQIKSTLLNASGILDSDQSGILSQLGVLRSTLQKIAPFHSSLEEFTSRTESALIELKELLRELESFESSLSLDEKKIAEISEKLSALYALQQKHRIQSTEELIHLRNELRIKCGHHENFDDVILSLKKKIEDEHGVLSGIASSITSGRKTAIQKAEKEVRNYFTALSLEHAELKIDLQESATFHSLGKDEVQFLFKANKGGQLLPVKQVASGGEISRVMLAIKAAIARHKKLPVLILDEIDQGVSGEVGKKIGTVLKEMSAKMQLLVITHLPQIAGKAEHHMKVYKNTTKDTTRRFVEELNEEERINELAEMLSGKSFTKAAIENAKELRSS